MKPVRNLIFTRYHKIRSFRPFKPGTRAVRISYKLNFHGENRVCVGPWNAMNRTDLLSSCVDNCNKRYGAGTHWLEFRKNVIPSTFTVSMR